MNLFSYLFVLDYGLPVFIISLIVGVLYFVLEKFLLKKLSSLYTTYIPFILGIILYSLYELIFLKKALAFSQNTLSLGLVCGSLSATYYSLFNRIKSGKSIGDFNSLTVEGILKNVVKQEHLTETIEKICKHISTENEDDAKKEEFLLSVLSPVKKDEFTINDLKKIIKLLLKALKVKQN